MKLLLIFSFCVLSNMSSREIGLTKLSLSLQNNYLHVENFLNLYETDFFKYEKAKELLDEVLIKHPDFIPAKLLDARLHIISGYIGDNDLKKAQVDAIEILNKIIKNKPEYAEAYLYKGYAYLNMLDNTEAEKSFIIAKHLGSKNAYLFHLFGKLETRKNNYKKAVEYYNNAFDLAKTPITIAYPYINAVDLAKRYRIPIDNMDIVDKTFKTFTNEEKTLKVANILMDSGVYNSRALEQSYSIILKQKKISTNSTLSDIELASWYLKYGHIKIKNKVYYYTNDSIKKSKEILLKYKDNELINNRVYKLLLKIAFSEGNIDLIYELIKEAKSKNILKNELPKVIAKIHYINADYSQTIDNYKLISKTDKSALSEHIYLSAIARNGKIKNNNYDSYKVIDNYYQRQVARYPDNLYVLGDYTSFLMGYAQSNSKKAIKYGEMALKLGSYGFLRDTLGVAYHIEASKTPYKEIDKKINLFKKSLSMNDKDYTKDSRCSYCTNYNIVKKLVSGEYKARIKKNQERIKSTNMRNFLGLLLGFFVVVLLITKYKKQKVL